MWWAKWFFSFDKGKWHPNGRKFLEADSKKEAEGKFADLLGSMSTRQCVKGPLYGPFETEKEAREKTPLPKKEQAV